jgi:hypothetical protein
VKHKPKPKIKQLYVRLSLENYAFVKRLSKQEHISLNKAFNLLIRKQIEENRGR